MNDHLTTKEFSQLLEAEQLKGLIENGVDCEVNRRNVRTSIKPGKKYTKINVGSSGKYMVDSDGNIWGIKAYGVIHHGHNYGTLDTIHEWNWRGYTATKKAKA